MSNLYTPLTADQRRASVSSFLDFVRQRDGEVDPIAHSLTRREAYFQQIDQQPIRSKRPLDLAKFDRNHRTNGEPETDLDPAMLWLLATAKLNRGERYGVEISMNYRQRRGANRLDDPMTFISVEEFYHTRILLDVLRMFDLEIEMLPPRQRSMRAIIKSMIYLPEPLAAPLAMAGEVAGVVAFYMMRNKAAQIFADDPAVLTRITSLYNEIMIDEIGHVAYARARLGKIGLAYARLVQPLVTKSVFDNVTELKRLFSPGEIKATFAEIDQILAGNKDSQKLPTKPYHFSVS